MKFLSNLDLNKNQLLNVTIQNLAAAPSAPVQGQIYFNTTDKLLYFYDNAAWKALNGDITSVVAGNGLTGGGTSGDVTLDVNVDNATIEIVGDVVRIKDLGVTTAKLADSSVTAAKIATDAVTTVKIANSNVTTAKIADANVTTAKIADANVTDVKLASNSVTTAKILDANVTTAKIADLNVTTGKIADSAVTDAKLASNAVTTIKVLDKNITFAKIQDLATMTVIGRVAAGTGVASGISVINDNTMATASASNLPTAGSVKAYVDSVAASLGNLEGSFNASTATLFPTGSGGTKAGDYWFNIAAGTVQGIALNVGDVLIAKVNNASTTLSDDWIFLESNRDQATTTVLGLVTLATSTEVNDGTDSQKVVTPSTLSARTATESRTGLAEIATNAEVLALTDDTRIVTPLKLGGALRANAWGYRELLSTSATTYTVTHNLGSTDVFVQVMQASNNEIVYADVAMPTANTVTISFATAPAANTYNVVIYRIAFVVN